MFLNPPDIVLRRWQNKCEWDIVSFLKELIAWWIRQVSYQCRMVNSGSSPMSECCGKARIGFGNQWECQSWLKYCFSASDCWHLPCHFSIYKIQCSLVLLTGGGFWIYLTYIIVVKSSLVAQTVKSACSVGDPDSVPGSGRAPGERNGNPLQYSCLEKSHGQRSLVGHTVHRVAKSQTRLRD